MIKEFNILLVGDFLSEEELRMGLNSFEEFYSNVTFKHQRKIKMTVVESKGNFPVIKKMLSERNIAEVCNLIEPENRDTVSKVLQFSSVMFLPTATNISKLVPIAFENALPILCLGTSQTNELLDQTCSLIVEVSTESEMETELSMMLRMLYFDPEACKILSKGSLNKFNIDYNWGRMHATG